MTAKDLKNALLQEAVQGKLVPQIASEGNARDLLEEIRKEKLSHGFANSYGICGEKGKKSKSSDLRSKSQIRVTKKELPDITEDEIPFEIPENWCWCRLSDIGEINRGRSQHRPRNDISLYENGTIPFIQTGDVAKANGIILEPKTFYNEKGLSQSKLWKKGTICLTIATNIGDVAVLNFDACFPDSVVGFNGYEKVSDNKYVMYTLMWYKDLLDKLSHSTAQKNINLEILSKIVFPLPPLSEQKRIVAAIEKFMPLIEEYGKKETELKAINEKVGTLTKKAILQEAVQGKLVPQIASEGNAKDLLEEIKKEKAKLIKEGKIKKEKPLPEITEDEIPFDIPENWCWCRLGDISTLVTKGTTPRGGNVAYSNEGIGFLRAENVVGIKDLDLSNLKYIDENTHTNFLKRSILCENDLLITIAGTLGRTAIVKKENLPLNANQAISIVRLVNYDLIDLNYLVFSINSPELQKKLIEKTKVTAIPNLTLEIIKYCLIPLPPLAEQKNIVQNIKKLLSLCEKLGD